MRFDHLSRMPVVCLLALILTTACGGREAARDDTDTSAEASAESSGGGDTLSPPAPPAPAAETNAASAPLAADDIARWEKGMAGELEAVRSASAKLKAAKTGEDTLSAMMGVQETATMDAGAKAAGVDLERYKVIRSNLSAAASYLTPQLGGIDTTILSPAQRAELKQMNEAQLKNLESTVPADVVQALRPRAEELRKRDLELVGARLKGAGM
ncbi:MAG TPA: hypothetical protein VMY76_04405 [Gemmatimonadales bacterium]|nr:hypothetical protein [Gemmatimonadales bacterium]